MPRRRRGSRASTSSEQSVNSDHSESLTLLDELPDPGLPKTSGKDVKDKKRVSFNFPVEVITKDGKFTGMGTIDLMETSAPSELAKQRKKAKEVIYDLTLEDKRPNIHKRRDLSDERSSKTDGKEQNADNKTKQEKKRRPPKKPIARVEPLLPNNMDKKKETEAETAADKRQAEEEKQVSADFEDMIKVYKPGECLKYMSVEMHPDLAEQWYMEDMKMELEAMGVPLVVTRDICDPGAVLWYRNVPHKLLNDGGKMCLTPRRQRCPRALYMMCGRAALSLCDAREGTSAGEWGAGLRAHVTEKHRLLGGRVTLVMFGAKELFNKLPTLGGQGARMNKVMFGKALTDLQMDLMVHHGIETALTEHSSELATLITQYTKALAEAPYKQAKREIEEQAEFYMEGDNKKCVTVDKNGNGLSRLWEQMLAVLPKSSLEIARCVGAQYTTPRALTEALQEPDGVAKIADMGVKRMNVPGAKPRRLGPEFTRKLHTLFTTEHGNVVIE